MDEDWERMEHLQEKGVIQVGGMAATPRVETLVWQAKCVETHCQTGDRPDWQPGFSRFRMADAGFNRRACDSPPAWSRPQENCGL